MLAPAQLQDMDHKLNQYMDENVQGFVGGLVKHMTSGLQEQMSN